MRERRLTYGIKKGPIKFRHRFILIMLGVGIPLVQLWLISEASSDERQLYRIIKGITLVLPASALFIYYGIKKQKYIDKRD